MKCSETVRPNVLDRRIRRSRKALQDALIELMIESGYENVTVQNVLDRANVGRATFYAHFRDKEDLLRSSLDNLRDALEQHWRSVEGGRSAELGFVLPFLRHIHSRRDIWRAIVGREVGSLVDRHMRRILGDLSRLDFPVTGVADEARIQFLVGSLMSLMAWWLDYEIQLSPEEINSIFLDLVRKGISRQPDR